jgi:DNA-binding beta-propeller fold protein YncE
MQGERLMNFKASTLVFALTMLSDSATAQKSTPTPTKGQAVFEGSLAVISDIDNQATAYGDGKLGRLPGQFDTLSLVRPSMNVAPTAALPVQQSVVGWPNTLAKSPDGRFIYIVETRGSPPANVERVKSLYFDMPNGTLLTVVDVSNPTKPVVRYKEAVGVNLGGISVRPDGKMLAIANQEEGKELVLISLSDGVPTARKAFPIEITKGEGFSRPGLRALDWHPDGKHIVVNMSDRIISFLRLEFDAAGMPTAAKPFGTPVTVGEVNSVVRFHPKGKYVLVTDLAWGSNSKPKDFISNGPGAIRSIAFDSTGTHRLAGEARVDMSPEGFDLSPDGTKLAVVNMARTYLPGGFPAGMIPGRDGATLSLVSFNPENGALAEIDRKPFRGLLPEDAAFDRSGNNIAVVLYETREDPKSGFVDYWRIVGGKLERQNVRTQVVRGANEIVLLP